MFWEKKRISNDIYIHLSVIWRRNLMHVSLVENEISSSTYERSLMSTTKEPFDRGSSENQSRPNILSPTHPEQENRYEIPSSGSNITVITGMDNKIVWNVIWDVNRALQACSTPGADIH
ncbi:hypothetical protein Ddye_013798 [Dipteronia dyeriana]|uniref:Uncharacterized protein n=1 Tax=Dipteronia dyeriana TaxID=168575 RepID=A0AAD9X741_9ROSI|nr:hypothetical protein Ddye_013798 [Dipteronia dyeriana]